MKKYPYTVIVEHNGNTVALKLSQIQVDQDDAEVYATMMRVLLQTVSKPPEAKGTIMKPLPLEDLDTILDELKSQLGNELRDYHEKYPDADYMDLSGYLVGLLARPQTKAALLAYKDAEVAAAKEEAFIDGRINGLSASLLYKGTPFEQAQKIRKEVNKLEERLTKLKSISGNRQGKDND
jgi:hypothetical protein